MQYSVPLQRPLWEQFLSSTCSLYEHGINQSILQLTIKWGNQRSAGSILRDYSSPILEHQIRENKKCWFYLLRRCCGFTQQAFTCRFELHKMKFLFYSRFPTSSDVTKIEPLILRDSSAIYTWSKWLHPSRTTSADWVWIWHGGKRPLRLRDRGSVENSTMKGRRCLGYW